MVTPVVVVVVMWLRLVVLLQSFLAPIAGRRRLGGR